MDEFWEPLYASLAGGATSIFFDIDLFCRDKRVFFATKLCRDKIFRNICRDKQFCVRRGKKKEEKKILVADPADDIYVSTAEPNSARFLILRCGKATLGCLRETRPPRLVTFSLHLFSKPEKDLQKEQGESCAACSLAYTPPTDCCDPNLLSRRTQCCECNRPREMRSRRSRLHVQHILVQRRKVGNRPARCQLWSIIPRPRCCCRGCVCRQGQPALVRTACPCRQEPGCDGPSDLLPRTRYNLIVFAAFFSVLDSQQSCCTRETSTRSDQN